MHGFRQTSPSKDPIISRSDIRKLLIALLVLGLAITCLVWKPFPWHHISSIVCIAAAICGGVTVVYTTGRALYIRHSLASLNDQLRSLLIDSKTPFLDIQGLRQSAFLTCHRYVFFSTELSRQGVHWLDIIYLQVLSIFSQHGFRTQIFLTEYTNGKLSDPEDQQHIRCFKRVARAICGWRMKTLTLRDTSFGSLRGKDIYFAIDNVFVELLAEEGDDLLSSPSRASKSFVWSIFLASKATGKHPLPYVKLQWANTSHRYRWLQNLGCQFVIVPNVSFIRKPEGPYFDYSDPSGSISKLIMWMGELPIPEQNTFAFLLAQVTDSLKSTWNYRVHRIIRLKSTLLDQQGDALKLFETPLDPTTVSNSLDREMLGWLLALQLQDIVTKCQ